MFTTHAQAHSTGGTTPSKDVWLWANEYQRTQTSPDNGESMLKNTEGSCVPRSPILESGVWDIITPAFSPVFGNDIYHGLSQTEMKLYNNLLS